MDCPKCGGYGIVVDTYIARPRRRRDGYERQDTHRHRRRECEGCGHRWTTVELPMNSQARRVLDAL